VKVFFSPAGQGGQAPGTYVANKILSIEFICSQGRKSHQASMERGMAFCAVMEKPALAIDQQP